MVAALETETAAAATTARTRCTAAATATATTFLDFVYYLAYYARTPNRREH